MDGAITQLKLVASDHKRYLTDMLDYTGIIAAQGTQVNAVASGLIPGTSFHNTPTTKESADVTTAGIPIQRADNADDAVQAVLLPVLHPTSMVVFTIGSFSLN